jgi:uncharacterized membrane protein
MTLPPLHPALVHFPIALVVVSVLADIFARISHSPGLRNVGWWSLVLAVFATAIAVPLGYYDMSRATLDAETQRFVDLHLRIGWLLFVAVVALALWRSHFRSDHNPPVGIGYLSCAVLAMALTLFQGWFGGEMVYSHGAGVAAAGQGTESIRQARSRLEKIEQKLGYIPGFAPQRAENKIDEPAGSERHHELPVP